MTPGRARPTLPSVVIGLVTALCAVLLLKWLAVVALVAVGVVLLVGRWQPWRRTRPDDDPAARVAPGPAVDPPVGVAPVALRTPVRASRDDCSWCGLAGGHRTVDGALRLPRHVHAAR